MIASVGRTVLLVLALFMVLAGINMVGRMTIPIADKHAPPIVGSALKLVF